jgi:hypothetical protein
MKPYWTLALTILTGCDAVQHSSGVVVDSETHLPIDSVAISKYKKEDSVNSSSKRIYTGKNGEFEYSGIGMTNSFELYFIKEGYKIRKMRNSGSDTIFLVPIKKPGN